MTDIPEARFCPVCQKPLKTKRMKVNYFFHKGSKTQYRRLRVCEPCQIAIRIGRLPKRKLYG